MIVKLPKKKKRKKKEKREKKTASFALNCFSDAFPIQQPFSVVVVVVVVFERTATFSGNVECVNGS